MVKGRCEVSLHNEYTDIVSKVYVVEGKLSKCEKELNGGDFCKDLDVWTEFVLYSLLQ